MTFDKATEYCFSDWEIFALHKSKYLTEKRKKKDFFFFNLKINYRAITVLLDKYCIKQKQILMSLRYFI